VQEPVLQPCILNHNMVGELETTLESPLGDALVEHIARLLLVIRLFLAADRQRVSPRFDRKISVGESGDWDRDAKGVLAVAGIKRGQYPRERGNVLSAGVRGVAAPRAAWQGAAPLPPDQRAKPKAGAARATCQGTDSFKTQLWRFLNYNSLALHVKNYLRFF
jgi:hypothetical protein